jgi:hypothetical protein
MTLADISERTGISTRRLRYVLEHGVLPGGKLASEGRGNERRFTEFEAYGIACAALLLEAGLRRRTVQRCLAAMCPAGRDLSNNWLYQGFYATGETLLEVGDNVNVRMQSQSILRQGKFDTGWLQLCTGARLQGDYQPLVTIRLDIGKLRPKLRGARGAAARK